MEKVNLYTNKVTDDEFLYQTNLSFLDVEIFLDSSKENILCLSAHDGDSNCSEDIEIEIDETTGACYKCVCISNFNDAHQELSNLLDSLKKLSERDF